MRDNDKFKELIEKSTDMFNEACELAMKANEQNFIKACFTRGKAEKMLNKSQELLKEAKSYA